MSTRHAMTEHARLALEAYGRGDMAAYRTHAGLAREFAAGCGLQVLRRDPVPPAHQFRPDFGIEGPDHEDDFLKQESALTAVFRWGAVPAIVVALAFAAGFIGRRLGWL